MSYWSLLRNLKIWSLGDLHCYWLISLVLLIGDINRIQFLEERLHVCLEKDALPHEFCCKVRQEWEDTSCGLLCTWAGKGPLLYINHHPSFLGIRLGYPPSLTFSPNPQHPHARASHFLRWGDAEWLPGPTCMDFVGQRVVLPFSLLPVGDTWGLLLLLHFRGVRRAEVGGWQWEWKSGSAHKEYF